MTLDEVSPAYIEALLTYEDRWFWHHPGINPLAIVRAVGQNLLQHGIVSGGSTLTMQVARLIDPQPRTLRGKVVQAWRAAAGVASVEARDPRCISTAPRLAARLRGVGAASWMAGQTGVAAYPRRGGAAGGAAAGTSRLRPDRWPQRAEAARNKVLDRGAVSGVAGAYRRRNQTGAGMAAAASAAATGAAAGTPAAVAVARQQNYLHAGCVAAARTGEPRCVAANRLPPRTSLALLVVDHSTMKVRGYVGSVSFNDDSRFGHVDMIASVRSPGSLLAVCLRHGAG